MGAAVCTTGLCGQQAAEEDSMCCAPLPPQFDFACDGRRNGSDVRLPFALAAENRQGDDGASDLGPAGIVPETPTANYFERERHSPPPPSPPRPGQHPVAVEPITGDGRHSTGSTAASRAVGSALAGPVPSQSSNPQGSSMFQSHVYESGATYAGEWLNGARHGVGEQEWPDGTSYTGEWCEDQAVGRGIFRHSNGDIYIGQWQGNVAHGLGVYRHEDQTSAYAGEFRGDLKEGHGVETWGEWARYEGQFLRGSKHGHGVYIWPDGSQYAGSWQGNRMEGAGEFAGRGRHFAGRWQASRMHGIGRSIWDDGRRYEGQYALDQKDGFGAFSWPDGRLYEGFWCEGSQHGAGWLRMEGSHVEPDKFAVAAMFANGQRVA